MIFALLGDDVTLPCGIPFINSCSSINWSMAGEFGSVSEVVEAGKITPPNNLRLGLLKDCSLKINQLVHNDARIYFCGSGELRSNVSLHILESECFVLFSLTFLTNLLTVSRDFLFINQLQRTRLLQMAQ